MTKDPGEETPREAASPDTGAPPSTPADADDPLARAASRGDDPLGMFATDSETAADQVGEAALPVEKPGGREPVTKTKPLAGDDRDRPVSAAPGPSADQGRQERRPPPEGMPLPYVRSEPRLPSTAPTEVRTFSGRPPLRAGAEVAPPVHEGAGAEQFSREPGTSGLLSAEEGPAPEGGREAPHASDAATPNTAAAAEVTATAVSELVAHVRSVAATRHGSQDARRPVPSTVPPSDWRISRPQPARPSIPRWALLVAGLLVVGAFGFGVWRLVRGMSNQPAAASTPPEGRLTVESLPTGAQVEIDGVVRGATPLGVGLKPGRHLVRVGGPGGREIDVVMAAGAQISHHIDLPDLTTRLHIETVPRGATIWVDGQRRGAAPLDLSDLSPGTHAVIAEAGGASVQRDVDVHAGSANSAVIALGGGGPTTGWVTVASPFEVEVYEGSRLVGRSADGQMLLVSGPHELTLTNADLGFKQASSVTVAAGRTATIRVQATSGQLSVNATPWAEVFLDGDRIGETPIANYATPIGRHEIVFRHPQYPEQRKTVIVSAASPTRVFATFTK